MARAFKSGIRGYTAHLEAEERRLLRSLFADVIQLLGGALPEGAETRDSVLNRPEDSEQPEQSEQPDESTQQGPADTASTGESSQDIDATFWDLVGQSSGLEPLPDRSDPAVAALLPPGRSGDDAQSGSQEFRDLAEDAIRADKIQDLQLAWAALQPRHLVLDTPTAQAFARALNQVRLVLATRLEITTEDDARKIAGVNSLDRAESVESYMALLYNFSSWLLDTLMVALMHGERG
ncbi:MULTISPECIES: DUF2017 family protein [Auritidibacter]|uniref:DUF2017 family protein n=1 Tax=Auritidibacter ignavus TaxID=678932 RepID=A0AAJ6DCE7_9MICC|nr:MULTISPECIES: DUF2017 family protein [Auritidibacter]PXA75486.1 DUF2017 domain-containing protein [Auritidibacter sp. NML120779]PXA75823.1 DUF2017 domain-containing protein [Auritidibacter sp. NML100628]WGH84065.1 DUF2017 family protein [Auritidibacter ignavus]WGH93389.1 DUF2017 family protein [Auritidibacter ignavus]WHS28258.1 DUF2017 family protein [Auritidibacter ignavus]